MQVNRRVLLVLVAVSALAGCEAPPNAYLRRHGIEAYEMRQLDKAERYFEQAHAQNAADWKTSYYLGRIRLEQGRALDAQILLEQSLTLRPDAEQTPGIIDALAEALYQQERYDTLHEMLDSVASQSGETRDFLRQAEYLAKTGDADGARIAFRKAAEFAADDDATPYLAMADFYESLGDGRNTVAALRRAYTIEPKNERIANRLRGYGLAPGPTLYVEKDAW